jgi:hypothetical protein
MVEMFIASVYEFIQSVLRSVLRKIFSLGEQITPHPGPAHTANH